MEMSSVSYCPHCGAEIQGDSLFCGACGRPIVGGGDSGAPVPYLISPARIILMSILTVGIYTIYWLYKTWQHYRDHTGAEAYPVWHGLTAVVPVYGSFRAHAHLRTFGELASAAGLTVGFSPGLAFFAIIVGWLGIFVGWSPALSLLVQIVSFIAGVWMMLHAQPRINYFWDQTYGARLRGVAFGKGEIILVIFGALIWLGLILSIFVDPEMAQNGANGGA